MKRLRRQTIGRALQQLDLTRKKSPSTHRNAGALRSSSPAASFAVESHTSTRRASFLQTNLASISR